MTTINFIAFCSIIVFLVLIYYAIKFIYLAGLYIFDTLCPFSLFKQEVIDDEH